MAIYTVLMFLLGSGFDTDEQFPWAAAVLEHGSIPDGAQRADRLYDEARGQLKKWLA